MAKLNIPTGGDDGGSKKKFVLPGGDVGAKGKLVVPGGAVEPEEAVPLEIPDAGEFGEIELSAGDDFLILEEAPTEGAAEESVQVAAMGSPEAEVDVEAFMEPERIEEVAPVRISSMAPPVVEDEGVIAESVEEVVYEEPVAAAEPMVVPAVGAPRLVGPVAEVAAAYAPPVQPHVPAVQQHAPPAQNYAPPPVSAQAVGSGYPPQGAMPPGAVPGREGQSALLQQTGYQPARQRMVPGWALMLVGILLGMVITILAVKFSPLGEMLVGPVMTVDELGYEE